MKAVLVAAVLFVLAGCTTTQEIRRPGGAIEYLIACGAALGWNICYKKANELCPTGYNTLSQDAGFNRKELRISCPGAKHAAETVRSSGRRTGPAYLKR